MGEDVGGEEPKREEDDTVLATEAAVSESRLPKMPLVRILVGGDEDSMGDVERRWGSSCPPAGG